MASAFCGLPTHMVRVAIWSRAPHRSFWGVQGDMGRGRQTQPQGLATVIGECVWVLLWLLWGLGSVGLPLQSVLCRRVWNQPDSTCSFIPARFRPFGNEISRRWCSKTPLVFKKCPQLHKTCTWCNTLYFNCFSHSLVGYRIKRLEHLSQGEFRWPSKESNPDPQPNGGRRSLIIRLAYIFQPAIGMTTLTFSLSLTSPLMPLLVVRLLLLLLLLSGCMT